MEEVYEKALKLHKEYNGKIEIGLKKDFNEDELKLVYTPGVAQPCKEIVNDKKIYINIL